MAALGTTASWSTAWNIVCSSSYSSYYTTSSAVSSYCSKTSALLAFTVFCFLGWFASLVMALLEKFAPKVAGSPMGWKGPKADDGVKVVMAPVMAPAATMPMTDAPSNGV